MSVKEFVEKLHRAIAYERRQGFCNSQGVQYNFSDFVNNESRRLIKDAKDLSQKNVLKEIGNEFLNYKDDCIADRKKAIEALYNKLAILERDPLDSPLQNGETKLKQEEKIIENTKTSQTKSVIVKEEKTSYSYNNKTPNKGSGWEEIPVQYIKGIGPKLAENLATAGIINVRDLFRYYPRKHLNYANRTQIRECKIGQLVTIWGVIKEVTCFTPPNNKNITIMSVTVTDGTGKVKGSWFYGSANRFMQEQYKKRYPIGAQALMSGEIKLDKFTKKIAMDRPEIEVLGDVEIEDSDSVNTNRIVPVYPLVEGLNLKWLRKTIKIALDTYSSEIVDPLPDWFKNLFNLFDLKTAIKEFHFPTDEDALLKSRNRLVFDELFYMQLGFAYKRKQEQLHVEGIVFDTEGEYVLKFLENLG